VARATELLSTQQHPDVATCQRAVQLLLPIVEHVDVRPVCRLLAKGEGYCSYGLLYT